MKKKLEIISSIKTMGKVVTAKGKTIEEAILNLKPEVCRGIGILVLEKGDIKREKVIQQRLVMGLYGKSSRTLQILTLKGVVSLFDKKLFE